MRSPGAPSPSDTAPPRWWETRAFVAAAILAAALPLLWPAVPPLTDLPGHIGRYRVMLGTDADILSRWYRFEWRLVGNLGVDLIVAALAPLTGLEAAVKIAVTAIPMLTVGGTLWLAREVHGRIPPVALFALPLAYCYPFHFGFVNYTLAMALALNALALWVRLGRQGRLRLRAALFVPIGLIVWLAHVVGWGMLGLGAFAVEAARLHAGMDWRKALPRAALACLPLCLPIVPLAAWRSGGVGLTERFFDLELKAWGLALVLRDRWFLFDLASTIGLWLLLYFGLRDRRFARDTGLSLAALLLFGAFLILPFSLFGSAYGDLRLAPYVLLLGLVALRPVPEFPAAKLALLGLAFFAVRTAGTTASLALYDRQWSAELDALRQIPRGARVAAFVGETCDQPWAHRRLNHLPGLAIARRAAFANDQWPIEGSALLAVTAPGVAGYGTDPSQIVLPARCAKEPQLRAQSEALAGFPRDRFDYLWLIDPHPYDQRLVAGLVPVWQGGTSRLYRIDQDRLPHPRPLP